MAETRATIRARVQSHVGTAIDSTINQAIKDAHRELQRKYNYRFMEAAADVPIAAGATTFSLPADFKAMLNPELAAGQYIQIYAGVGYIFPAAEADTTFALQYYRWLPEPPVNDLAYVDDARAQQFLDEVREYVERMAIAAGFRRLKSYDDAQAWGSFADEKRRELEHDDTETGLAGVELVMEMPG